MYIRVRARTMDRPQAATLRSRPVPGASYEFIHGGKDGEVSLSPSDEANADNETMFDVKENARGGKPDYLKRMWYRRLPLLFVREALTNTKGT